jgi:NDP-sugar pyrophosphorylase family protein
MPVQLEGILAKTWAYQHNLQGQIKLAILAAGLGSRMDPIPQHHLPKPMFPLGGVVPMVELWVRRAVELGITDISMNLCVLKDTISSYFRDGRLFGAQITYAEEKEPSGTLGGVCKQALGREAKLVTPGEEPLPQPPFAGSTLIVPSGDIVTDLGAELLQQMYDLHRRQGAAFTMLLTPVPWDRRKDFGTVQLGASQRLNGLLSEAGPIVAFLEKDPNSPSNLNNASVYIIEMDLLRQLDPLRTAAAKDIVNPFYDFGKHVFPALLGQLPYARLPRDYPLWGVRYDGQWFDVGRKRDYLGINQSILDGHISLDLPYQKYPWGYLGNNVVMNLAEVTIIPPVVIGHDCIIENGAVIGPYAVIGDGWTIERDARISRSVLWRRYAFFTKNGDKIPIRERKLVDRHEVRRGTVIDRCIIIGGTMTPELYGPGQSCLAEQTIDVLENGELQMVSIDWVPSGPRL